MPDVSVVMPVFNGEDHVAEAIESILQQDLEDFEFIIVDDGSQDTTPQILADYARRDDRIRIVTQANGGVTRALLSGIAEARGRYVARMDADDLSMPDRLRKQVALLLARPELVAVTCHIEHFGADGRTIRVEVPEHDPRLLPLLCCFFNRVGGGGQIMFDRAAYDAVGGFDPEFRVSEDYDLWTRMFTRGDFGVVEEVLYRYRTGHESISSRNKELQIALSTRVSRREYERLTGEPMDEKTARALIYFWWARKPETTPMTDTIAASRAMHRAIDCFFRKNPQLAAMEAGLRRTVMANWRWRIPLAGKFNLTRRGLLLAHALAWWVSAAARLGNGTRSN